MSYTAVVTAPVYRLEYMEPIVENNDLTSDEASMLAVSMNATKLLELERSIKSIELDRESLNITKSTISGEMKEVISATISQSKEKIAMQVNMESIYSTRLYNMLNVGIPVECDHFDSRSMHENYEAGLRGRAYPLTYMSVVSDSHRPRPSRIIGCWNSGLVHGTMTIKAEKYDII
jgi:hypothetical protein